MKIKKENELKNLLKKIQNKGPIPLTDLMSIQIRLTKRAEIKNQKLKPYKIYIFEIFTGNILTYSVGYETFKSLYKEFLKILKENNLNLNNLTIAVKEKIL